MQQPWVVALATVLTVSLAADFRTADEKALEAEYQTKEKEKVRAEMSRILCLADEWQGMGAADPTKPKAKQAFDALVDDVEGDVVARFKLTAGTDEEMLLICTRTKALLGECFQEEMVEALQQQTQEEQTVGGESHHGAAGLVTSLESGSRLEELMTLGDKILQTKVLQRGGSLGGECTVDAHTLQAVRSKYQAIGMGRRESLKKLLSIMKPLLPVWLFGACFAAYVETWSAFTLLRLGGAV
jgi:hypothetical protein